MGDYVKHVRNSNLELYRVIVMLLIVSHHYVVNSGLFQLMDNSTLNFNSSFLYIFGMWGKTGIDCFVLITGYFMCKSEATVFKFFKLVLEIIFYNIIIYSIFLILGIVELDLKGIVRAIIPLEHTSDFTTGFILFYPFIPFLNKIIKSSTHKEHLKLIILSLFIYTFLYMAPGFGVTYNYITWFIVLYFISSYIRLYPSPRYDTNNYLWGGITILLTTISIASVFVLRNWNPYWLVSDSNAIFAVAISISSFMFFKNLKIKHSKIINLMGASTFGVLLIHANSDAMRQWLWKNTLQNTEFFTSPYLWIHAILSVLIIFIICVIIDQIRIRYIEKPFFNTKLFNNVCNKIESLLK